MNFIKPGGYSGGNTDYRGAGECLMSIELKNVTYTYSPGTAYEIHALKDVNLSIPDGQFIGIIGHTGSGKSTLIQHFNALIRPTSGTITYNGEDIWGEKYDRRALRSEVGLVFSIRSISFSRMMSFLMSALDR